MHTVCRFALAGVMLRRTPIVSFLMLQPHFWIAQALAPVLSEAVVNEMSCVGSLLIIGIALNVLNLTKLKLANYIPAIFLPILLCKVM